MRADFSVPCNTGREARSGKGGELFSGVWGCFGQCETDAGVVVLFSFHQHLLFFMINHNLIVGSDLVSWKRLHSFFTSIHNPNKPLPCRCIRISHTRSRNLKHLLSLLHLHLIINNRSIRITCWVVPLCRGTGKIRDLRLRRRDRGCGRWLRQCVGWCGRGRFVFGRPGRGLVGWQRGGLWVRKQL